MRIPYVIDNQKAVMAQILGRLLTEHQGQSMDVATAYFTVGGFELLRPGLEGLGSFRLLLGAEPEGGSDLGLRPNAAQVQRLLKKDLETLPYAEQTLRLVEDLIAYLRRDKVQVRLHKEGFLHAKAWLFYADKGRQAALFDRFNPVAAIVGSSNFTRPGLSSNRELNLAHQVFMSPEEAQDDQAEQSVRWLSKLGSADKLDSVKKQLLKSEVGARAILDLEQWYTEQWGAAEDFKEGLIKILDESKFGQIEYSPWQVYLKALFAYFQDDLEGTAALPGTRSAVDLAEFQDDAVKKARKVIARYDGVMIADSVGLGKTWIGKKLLEDFAYHLRQKAVVVCPASLRPMWEAELSSATISAEVLSQEEIGQEDFNSDPYGDADVVLVDESHNFRNPNSQRYLNLDALLAKFGGRGRGGLRKKVILLTATPINNDLFDLYHQINLIARNDRSYFSGCGIGDLYKYFLKVRAEAAQARGMGEVPLKLFNLLEEVVVRRTRPYIRKAYPEATIHGKKVRFPERRLHTVHYDLEAAYEGIYDKVVALIDGLVLPPYNLASYKKEAFAVDAMEAGREQALVGIFKSRYLKRLESSIEAFRISVLRAIRYTKTFEDYILEGKVLDSASFRKATAKLQVEEQEDEEATRSLSEEMDASDAIKELLAALPTAQGDEYRLKDLHRDLRADTDALEEIWDLIKDLKPAQDAKLNRLKGLLDGELKGKKVLIFSYFRDTARYLYANLGTPVKHGAADLYHDHNGLVVRRIDSGVDAKERTAIVHAFAPKANNKLSFNEHEREINVLISTDVLSEGQNLQDCGTLVNYDLHWNPTRMVQRAGRVDRLGTDFETLGLYNLFPDAGLERLLGLVASLNAKIESIDRAGFLDASILGEEVHPQNFNALRRIEGEDGTILDEVETFADLASSEYLLRQVQDALAKEGREALEDIPDGIHSGQTKAGQRGIFFYFRGKDDQGKAQHFWRYWDEKSGRIEDNRYLLANLIQCQPDTPRMVEPGLMTNVFEIQEKVLQEILSGFEYQQALEAAPKLLEKNQLAAIALLRGWLNKQGVERAEIVSLLGALEKPASRSTAKALEQAAKEFAQKQDIGQYLARLEQLLQAPSGAGQVQTGAKLRREDLQLVCFETIG
jgi:superfamily II DNA or RNA helicase